MKKLEVKKLYQSMGISTLCSVILVLAISWWQVSSDFFVARATVLEQPSNLAAINSQAAIDDTVGAGTSDRVKGKVNQTTGAVEREFGDYTDDYTTEAKGAAKQLKGEAQENLGEAKGEMDKLGSKMERGTENFTDAVKNFFNN